MSAILFDRDEVDRLEELSDRPGRLRGAKLLWVDLHDGSEFSADQVADELDLDDETRRCLATPNKKACFNDHGRYIHLTTYAPHEDDEGELHALECVVGQNWVVTAHDRPIPVLSEFGFGRYGLS
jgi:Mg2+ and Co2+ transporter CorA